MIMIWSMSCSYYVMLCGMLMIRFAIRGHYTQRAPWWTQVRSIMLLLAAIITFDILIHLSVLGTIPITRILAVWLFTGGWLIFGRSIALHAVSRAPDWKLHVALIGDAQVITDSFYALNSDGLTGYEIKVVLVQGHPAEKLDLSFLPKNYPPVDVIYVTHDIDAFVREHAQYFYIISIDGLRGERRDRLMEVLSETGRDYAVIPPIKRLDLYGAEPHYFFGNDIMLLHRRGIIRQSFSLFLKRAMDMVASGLALVPLSILTVAVWAVKKVEGSKSPLFYGGMRVGRKGELFPCWKFCTMKPGADKLLQEVLAADPAAKAEWEKYQKLRDDPRIDSSISKLLRKTSLDELPQLWNVFCGDMSLVGPRPILPDQKEEYGEVYPQYITVRPGLTGLWQVSGRNETSFEQRIIWDRWYIQNWSLWHDIVILIKTVRVFLTGSGAY
jgi:Undecaprenyl-phosphate galactose phosphotransferase WbaP